MKRIILLGVVLLNMAISFAQAPANYPNKAICTETTTGEEGEQKITKTCIWGDFKSVSIGYEDGRGHLDWEHGLYRKLNGKYAKVSNGELFGTKRSEVLTIFNAQISKDYQAISTERESKDCFAGMERTAPHYTFDKMGLYFDGENAFFSVSYGLITACRAVDGTIITLPLETIKPFLAPTAPSAPVTKPSPFANQKAVMLGKWTGNLGDKPLTVVIEKIEGNVLTGYNIVGTNQRPLKGTFVDHQWGQLCSTAYEATLKEPGDDKWDGVFTIVFVGYEDDKLVDDSPVCIGNLQGSEAHGSWEANNGQMRKICELLKQD